MSGQNRKNKPKQCSMLAHRSWTLFTGFSSITWQLHSKNHSLFNYFQCFSKHFPPNFLFFHNFFFQIFITNFFLFQVVKKIAKREKETLLYIYIQQKHTRQIRKERQSRQRIQTLLKSIESKAKAQAGSRGRQADMQDVVRWLVGVLFCLSVG